MKTWPWLLISLLTLGITASAAEQRKRPERIVSPELKDGAVTFRYKAPQAKEVKVNFPGLTNYAMLKDPKGVWSLTLSNLAPELYLYNFQADGVATLDPENGEVKLGLRTTDSLVEVPSVPPAFYALRDVPHGTVTIHTIMSKALGTMRRVSIYTPPGYGQQPEPRYPVLYLCHGSGDDERGWPTIGRVPEIADNLLAEKQCRPMIIVMPNGSYPRKDGSNREDFEKDLLEVILPLVEANYRTLPDAKHRAMAGLSMGAAQTLYIGMKHQELFHWLGVFSIGVKEEYAETHGPYLATANANLSLLWVGIGDRDFLVKEHAVLEKILNDKGVKHISKLSPGGHTWTNWRNYLHEFLPLLF